MSKSDRQERQRLRRLATERVKGLPSDLLLEAIAHKEGVTGSGYLHVTMRDGFIVSIGRGMRHKAEELEELFGSRRAN